METITTEAFSTSTLLDSNKADRQAIKEYKNSPITGKTRNIVFAGMTVGVSLMFIMFAAQIITGVFALILTVGTAVGGYLGLRTLKTLDPLIQQKVKNAKLAWMIEEAQKNSIAQLNNTVLANAQKLANGREATIKVKAQLRALKGKLGTDTESANYKRKMETINTVETAYKQMVETVDRIALMDKEFKKKVQDYCDMKDFADAAGNIMKLISSNTDSELDEMLSLEAFDSIESEFNEAVSTIESAAHYAAIDNA